MPEIRSRTAKDSLVYVNGRVYTVNKSQPWAEAFIVSPEGKFIAIGSTQDISARAAKEGLLSYDLHQAFVMPGIHDAHMHVMIAGLQSLNEADIGVDSNASNIAEKIKQGSCGCAYANAYGDWIVANSFSNEFFPDGKPDRTVLDAVFPDTPVMVRGLAGHNYFMNTEALIRAGYDPVNESDYHGARHTRREDGSMTGELMELAATKAMMAIPKPPLSHIKRALKHAVAVAHRAGVTSCQEASASTLYLMAMKELDEEGKLDMDISAHILCSPEALAGESKEDLLALLDVADTFKSEHVDTRFVKFLLDGVPLPPLFTHCELDEQGKPNPSKILVPDLAEALARYDQRGMTCKIHCAGTGSTRMALDVIALARKQNPNGPRHEIAHCNGIHEGIHHCIRRENVTNKVH
jgi:predicted amidohydrolase YtcJ